MKRVLLLVPKGVELYEMSAFYDVFGWAALEGLEPVELVCAGPEREVRSAFGLKIVLDHTLNDISADDFDALAVPGGFEEFGFYDHAYSEPVSDLIRKFQEQDKPIASICVGALPVAKSGILEGRQATTYALGGGKRREQLAGFGAEVLDCEIVEDGRIMTSTGPGTAVEVAFRLLESTTSRRNADHVRDLMGFPPFTA